jgi:spore coat polysaccharide biosynthesis protein SpsF
MIKGSSPNIVAIIQARTSAKRFPNKIFLDLKGYPLIWHVVERIKQSKLVNKIILATTNNQCDEELVTWSKENRINYFTGSENNVLKRFYDVAKLHNADIIVRITADDPFKDPHLLDKAISTLLTDNLDFVCNNNPPTFPEGLDVEVFTFKALNKAFREVDSKFEKEHLTQYFHKNKKKFKQKNISSDIDLSSFRWTIDYQEDYEMVKVIYEKLYVKNKLFSTQEIMDLLKINPDIKEINSVSLRSHMYRNR